MSTLPHGTVLQAPRPPVAPERHLFHKLQTQRMLAGIFWRTSNSGREEVILFPGFVRSLRMFRDDLFVSKIFPFNILLFCLALQGRKSFNCVIKPIKFELAVSYMSLTVSSFVFKIQKLILKSKGYIQD